LGLAVAAAAHVAYLAASAIDFGLNYATVGAVLAVAGLLAAAWAARGAGDPKILRVGFATAAAAGLAWTVADFVSGSFSFLVGDIFAAIGFATAAWFVAPEVV